MEKITFENLCLLLKEKNIVFETLEHKPVYTMADVVAELNIPTDTMAKALLVSVKGQGLKRIVLPGMARLNVSKLALTLGLPKKSIQFADKQVVEGAGFTVGAIPPFGGSIPTYIDQALLNQSLLYCGAGENTKTFSLKPQDVVFISGALVADLSE